MADEAVPVAKSPAPDTQKSITQKSDTQKSDTQKSDTQKSDTQKSGTQSPDTETPSAQLPVEYEPLDKVADTIRKNIAQQRIEERAGAQFSQIEGMLDDYRIKLERYRANLTTNKNAKKPEPPTLAEMLEKANAANLEGQETELISDRTAYNSTDLGKSRRMITPGNFDTPSFIQTAYNPTLKFYKADRTDDNDNNQYLWWKTADEPAHVPTLEDIKPEVVQAWKMIQARKPAMAKAEENAAQARKLKQTLKDTFGDNAGISNVGPFSWYSRSLSQPFGPPWRTEVAGVDSGGDAFLRAVFALAQGQTGVAPNEPQTVFYVVQIESEKPTLDELHQQFMVAMSSPYTALAYAGIGCRKTRAWASPWRNNWKANTISR